MLRRSIHGMACRLKGRVLNRAWIRARVLDGCKLSILACGLTHFAAAAAAGDTVVSQPSDPLPAVTLDGNYFSVRGKRFVVTGAHWVPAKSAVLWSLNWDAAGIEADFARMAQMKFNTVRIDLLWGWFEPMPGIYNPKAFEQLDYLISLAHRHRIYLHPSLFIGGEVGEAFWDVPWRAGRNPQSDPEMLRLETNHAREFARRYAHETAIIAWDLTDEPPFWIVPDASDAAAINWTRLIGGALRREDHEHPIVVGTSTQDLDHGPFRPDLIAGDVDFLSTHPYTIYEPELFPDAMGSERGTYGAAFATALNLGAGKPVLIQELGASNAQYAPERVADFDRTSMYSAFAAGANGVLLWCFTDADQQQYARAPYARAPHETQFGLTEADGTLRPAGKALMTFEEAARSMDLAGIERPRAEVALLVPQEWSRARGDFTGFNLPLDSTATPYVSVADVTAGAGTEAKSSLMSALLAAYVMARRAGLSVDLPREFDDWHAYPLLWLPAPLTATEQSAMHVRTPTWERIHDYVKAGGALFVSVSGDAAIPDMAALFGARMVDAAPAGEVSLKIVKAFGGLRPGELFKFAASGSGQRLWGVRLELAGGEVIAVDQDGRPALVANRVGAGHVLLAAYPLETYLGATPSAFDGDAAGVRAHRIVQAFAAWAGIVPGIRADRPSVEVASLPGAHHGYLVLVNHEPSAQSTHISSSLPARSLRALGSASPAISGTANRFNVTLPGYAGEILEWSDASP